ncbi:hypothetical protein, partial [Clostridium perfringens]
ILEWHCLYTKTCGRHNVLRAFAAELGQQAGFLGARETYANQVIFRARRWWSLAAKRSKTQIIHVQKRLSYPEIRHPAA